MQENRPLDTFLHHHLTQPVRSSATMQLVFKFQNHKSAIPVAKKKNVFPTRANEIAEIVSVKFF
jgi:hypothetical protein